MRRPTLHPPPFYLSPVVDRVKLHPPIMYPSKTNAYPAPAPPAATGVPVSSINQFNNHDVFESQSQGRVPWSTGLCSCGDDVGNCCMTCFCPCITFGQIAEIVDRGSTSCGASGALYTLISFITGCQCIYSCFYRSKLRAQFSLPESPCNDCLVHCFCEACALCQEYRELKRRGFDMNIGWHANMERQGQGITIPPIMQGGMSR